jgi:hypothetical protein
VFGREGRDLSIIGMSSSFYSSSNLSSVSPSDSGLILRVSEVPTNEVKGSLVPANTAQKTLLYIYDFFLSIMLRVFSFYILELAITIHIQCSQNLPIPPKFSNWIRLLVVFGFLSLFSLEHGKMTILKLVQ